MQCSILDTPEPSPITPSCEATTVGDDKIGSASSQPFMIHEAQSCTYLATAATYDHDWASSITIGISYYYYYYSSFFDALDVVVGVGNHLGSCGSTRAFRCAKKCFKACCW